MERTVFLILLLCVTLVHCGYKQGLCSTTIWKETCSSQNVTVCPNDLSEYIWTKSFCKCRFEEWKNSYNSDCSVKKVTTCNYYTVNLTLPCQVCDDGYTGPCCNIPICSNCKAGEYCSAPDQCSCYRTLSGDCLLVGCGGDRDCYPGSCTNYNCNCPPGFSGRNCDDITYQVTLERCAIDVSVKLSESAIETTPIKDFACSRTKETRPLLWINTNIITSVRARWTVKNELVLPSLDKSYTVGGNSLKIKTGFTFNTSNVYMGYDDCKNCDGTFDWSKLGALGDLDGKVISMTFTANVTGYKTLRSTGQMINFVYKPNNTMDLFLSQILFGFDLTPPYHCSKDGSRSSLTCTQPVTLNQSITSKSQVQAAFDGWMDDGSGIQRYEIYVFQMVYSQANGQLDRVSNYLEWHRIEGSSKPTYTFSCRDPGVYGIYLYVYDFAGNMASARKIFLYNPTPIDKSDMAALTFGPDYNLSYSSDSAVLFLTKLKPLEPKNPSYSFIINFTNCFLDTNKKEWKLPVVQWPVETKYTYDDYYGARSVKAMDNFAAIVGFSYTYRILDKGGYNVQNPSQGSLIPVPSKTQMWFTLNLNNTEFKNGMALVIWIVYYDITDDFNDFSSFIAAKSVPYMIVLDADPTALKTSSKEYNAGTDEEFLRVKIGLESDVSGVKQIKYNVLLSETNNVILSDIFQPQLLQFSNNVKRDTVGGICNPRTDSSCYCMKANQMFCFKKVHNIDIDKCKLDKYADFSLALQFTAETYSGNVLSDQVPMGVFGKEKLLCRSLGLPPGIIVGIVIASILAFIFCCLFLIVCILYRCYPKNKYSRSMHEVYQSMRNLKKKKSAEPRRGTENEIYVGVEQIHQYDSIDSPTLNNEDKIWKFAPDDIDLDEILSKGSFFVVHKGTIKKTYKQSEMDVAVKVLKDPDEPENVKVMWKNIEFMKNRVTPHDNIIRFIGFFDGPEASGMIFELCDMKLEEWLEKIIKVTSVVLDCMVNFAADIAMGLEHLHSINIIHRRPALKNVMLMKISNTYRAKLIGFGCSDDLENGKNLALPIKWLAPETLQGLLHNSIVFTKETDVWSFGVTLWELFSFGKLPFSNFRSADMLEVLERGTKLDRPADCPPEIYNSILMSCWEMQPELRPTMSRTLQNFRRLSSVAWN